MNYRTRSMMFYTIALIISSGVLCYCIYGLVSDVCFNPDDVPIEDTPSITIVDISPYTPEPTEVHDSYDYDIMITYDDEGNRTGSYIVWKHPKTDEPESEIPSDKIMA